MSVQLRSRKKSSNTAVEVVKQLDSFPKVNKDDFIERSSIGGVASIIAYTIIVLLIIFEIRYYYGSDVAFQFVPDTDFNAKLKVNLDITVAMPCHSIGADILDSTNQNFMVFGTLEEEDTWFEMSEEQKAHFEDIRYFNSYLTEEFHAVNDLLWKSAHSFQPSAVPKRSTIPNQAPDACRVFGSLELNKVAGNLHITAGKSLNLPDGHIHLPVFMFQSSFNFSHRIHHLSFGDSTAGIIHPLDGDEKITQNPFLQHTVVQHEPLPGRFVPRDLTKQVVGPLMPRPDLPCITDPSVYHTMEPGRNFGAYTPFFRQFLSLITTLKAMTLYQYFIEIVPTDVETFLSQAKTYQYSVKENMRAIDHDNNSHGMPGIYLKYDFSALKVIVTQTREPLFQFFVRLSSTVAGIFVIAGILSNLAQIIIKRLNLEYIIDQKLDSIPERSEDII